MSNEIKFLEKLNGLKQTAQQQGSQITIEEVKAYFSEELLTEEQMELVFDYLLSQKIVVKGYIKMANKCEEESGVNYTEEEKQYLEEYLQELSGIKEIDDSEKNSLLEQALKGEEFAKARLIEAYLKQVVEIAKEMYHPEIFLGDLVQEGNLGVVLGVEMLSNQNLDVDIKKAEVEIFAQIRQSMQLLIEEQTEVSKRDKKMVEKVNQLDEAIKNLTEELGRKVTIDELAIYMGMEIEEIEDILKLAGEEEEE